MDKICRNCGFHNTAGSVFCMKCGSRLDTQIPDEPCPRICVSCGARLTGDFASCPELRCTCLISRTTDAS